MVFLELDLKQPSFFREYEDDADQMMDNGTMEIKIFILVFSQNWKSCNLVEHCTVLCISYLSVELGKEHPNFKYRNPKSRNWAQPQLFNSD